MDTNAKPVSVSLTLVPPVAPPASINAGAGQDRSAREAERAARYRLIIEEGPTKGTFIYKTLDSETGEIVRQFPREEVIKLSTARNYAQGTVADTKV